jgi:hypothetical protein
VTSASGFTIAPRRAADPTIALWRIRPAVRLLHRDRSFGVKAPNPAFDW